MILENNEEYVVFKKFYWDTDLDKLSREKYVLSSRDNIHRINGINLYELLDWSLEYNVFKSPIELINKIWY